MASSQEDKIAEKLAGKRVEKPVASLPIEITYSQKADMGDYIQEERVNVQQARGYDHVVARIPIPPTVSNESMKLEVQPNKIVFSCEDGHSIFRAEKLVEVKLRQKNSQAKLKNLDDDSVKRTGCRVYLEVTVEIDADQESKVQQLMKEAANIKFVEAGKSREREEAEAKLPEPELPSEPAPKVSISDELKLHADQWKSDEPRRPMVEVVRDSNAGKSLE